MKNNTSKLVSIIIRTKNEERWISQCLKSLHNQTYKNFEVIIVDNYSTDQTIQKAKFYPVKIIQIENFFPGKAINDGVRNSSGELLVCLSAHCIPVNENWLENLISGLEDPNIAGVYGRQEPLSYSSDFDKRDLINTFGLDKKIQIKDSFFHNANSAFTRKIWKKFPFNEDVKNIEDRLWGHEVISSGMNLVYEPDASVYHWHGIHQNLNIDRCSNVVKILESLQNYSAYKNNNIIDIASLNIVAIIPIKGKSRKIDDINLLDFTASSIKKTKYIKEAVVSTDDLETKKKALDLGLTAPFLRPPELSEPFIDISDVIKWTLEKLEFAGNFPDLIVVMEESYPFRSAELIDLMIEKLINGGFDTILASKTEDRAFWMSSDDKVEIQGDGFMPRELKATKAIVGLMGYACITYPNSVREGKLLGEKIGIFDLPDSLMALEVKNEQISEQILEVVKLFHQKI